MKSQFENLYLGNVENQRKRYEDIAKNFYDFFGAKGDLEFFSAPGRTEVGGNHTDHQHGRVVAASVDLDIVAAVQKTDDNKIILKSAEYKRYDTICVDELEMKEDEKEKSASLIRGICARCKELGYNVGGFKAFTATNVLKGSGLSSSAAFEVLVVTIINHLYNNDSISPIEVAQIAQYAENVYFGKPSGLLDQMASSVGGFAAMDFANPKEPVIERVEFNLQEYGYHLCVVDTGGNHADLTNEYAAIPMDNRKIAEFFGKSFLREVNEGEFRNSLKALREKYDDRAVLRAMHFFDDNRIAELEKEALSAKDFEEFKRLVIKSGRSSFMKLQNVFACSSPNEQGLSLALAISEDILDGKGAYRVHGGGFAGTIQAYVPDELLNQYVEKMESVFGGNSCYILSVRNVGGTKVLL